MCIAHEVLPQQQQQFVGWMACVCMDGSMAVWCALLRKCCHSIKYLLAQRQLDAGMKPSLIVITLVITLCMLSAGQSGAGSAHHLGLWQVKNAPEATHQEGSCHQFCGCVLAASPRILHVLLSMTRHAKCCTSISHAGALWVNFADAAAGL